MRGIFCLSILFALILNESAQAQVPNLLQITGITASGSGCRQGQISSTIAPDNQSFSLLFDNYIAESSENMGLDRRQCDVRIGLSIPAGWTYAIVGVDYRGFAQVDAGSIVTHQALYSFTGAKPKNERPGFQDAAGVYSFKQTQFRGPYVDNYSIHNEIDARLAPWSPCSTSAQQTLFVTTYLMAQTMSRQASHAMITLDSVDGQVQSQTYKMIWKSCSVRPVTPAPGDRGGLRPPRVRGG